jgi:hypothetical protein
MKPTNALPILVIFLFQACTSSKKTSSTKKESATNQKDTYSNTFSSSQAKLLDDQTFQLDSISIDETYGYSTSNPIHVGGTFKEGAVNQRRFLNALLGPDNELIHYQRRGSCCAFATKNGMNGFGLLDIYEVTYDGLAKPIVLYLNFYDYGMLKAPKGFTYKK